MNIKKTCLVVASGLAASLLGAGSAHAQEAMIGEVRTFGFNFCPRGWASTDGQLLPISQYQALFSLLGTMYGGDGRTTFALPDLRGRAVVARGQGPGLSNYPIGQRGGREAATLSERELPPHAHAVDVPAPDQSVEVRASNNNGVTIPYSAGWKQQPTSTVGNGAPLDLRQPYTAMTQCIALQGIYPSRS